MGEAKDSIALTEGVYYILLSLMEPLHGYGIMQKVADMSGGRVNLAPGTLYGAINALLGRGWIIATGTDQSARKKEYVITESGLEAVRNELCRLQELLANGQRIIGGNSDEN